MRELLIASGALLLLFVFAWLERRSELKKLRVDPDTLLEQLRRPSDRPEDVPGPRGARRQTAPTRRAA